MRRKIGGSVVCSLWCERHVPVQPLLVLQLHYLLKTSKQTNINQYFYKHYYSNLSLRSWLCQCLFKKKQRRETCASSLLGRGETRQVLLVPVTRSAYRYATIGMGEEEEDERDDDGDEQRRGNPLLYAIYLYIFIYFSFQNVQPLWSSRPSLCYTGEGGAKCPPSISIGCACVAPAPVHGPARHST